MALVLSSASITTGQTIRSGHVTQSINALTGTEAYDITISGSLTVIGPTDITGSVGVSNDLDVVGTIFAGEVESVNLTLTGIADIVEANIDSGIISASFTGSLLGTASYVTGSSVFGPNGSNSILTASFASTASYILNAQTASYVLNAVSSSFASTSSYTPNALITASVSLNTITFTKGNGSTFPITVDTGSISPTGNDYEIQFNSASVFGATSSFKFNYLSQSLEQGDGVSALGLYSHAEGIGTQTLGPYSHAEGLSSISYLDYSHAEGDNTQTNGLYSHAEGGFTITEGDWSHAEGYITLAKGEASHAEGSSSITLGVASHAGGLGTIASGSFQTVVGQYNAQNNTTDRFIVGTGTSATRRDGFTVTHSGSIRVLTQSAAPTWTGREGEIVPANVSGTYRIYVYIGGAWRSASLS